MGTVELGGKVIRHQYGYRAQKAKLVNLLNTRGLCDVAGVPDVNATHLASRLYNVPVNSLDIRVWSPLL